MIKEMEKKRAQNKRYCTGRVQCSALLQSSTGRCPDGFPEAFTRFLRVLLGFSMLATGSGCVFFWPSSDSPESVSVNALIRLSFDSLSLIK